VAVINDEKQLLSFESLSERLHCGRSGRATGNPSLNRVAGVGHYDL
jgi:hypothetical protein